MTDVLQVLLGAGILGVLLTQIATWWRERRERHRERRGLLRVLFTEVSPHQDSIETLRFYYEQAEKGDPKAERNLQTAPSVFVEGMETQAWEDTRLKLAQALSTEEFAALASYYQALQSTKEIVAEGMETLSTYRAIRFAVNRLHELGQEVDRVIRTHVPDIGVGELTGEDLKRLGYTREDTEKLGYE